MATAANKNNISLEQVLRLQTRLDLIFDVDLINDFIDVRSAMVLDIGDDRIIVTQSDPPILKSMVGREMEATFVRRDPVTSQVTRWGWRCQIVEYIQHYQLHGDHVKGETVVALALSRPSPGGLNETNARMDYRLSPGTDTNISIQTHPSFGRVNLLDFSAGGALIAVPSPPQAKVGMRLWFTLFFPLPSSSGPQTTINGEAEVVRVTVDDGARPAKVGLKFMDLDLNATRSLQKAVNHYMLEEQRNRNRNLL